MKSESNTFDSAADRYDRWYESNVGRRIFAQEVKCLRAVMPPNARAWLEVGVGTGRFAAALGVDDGVDPSPGMLALAASRGIHTKLGCGESLPYEDERFDGFLMVTTLCFVSDASQTMAECRRVLKAGGWLIVGLIPRDSTWGAMYQRKGKEGHAVYAKATFHSCNEVIQIATEAGFVFRRASSCLTTTPDIDPLESDVHPGIVIGAGFVALGFNRADRP